MGRREAPSRGSSEQLVGPRSPWQERRESEVPRDSGTGRFQRPCRGPRWTAAQQTTGSHSLRDLQLRSKHGEIGDVERAVAVHVRTRHAHIHISAIEVVREHDEVRQIDGAVTVGITGNEP